ncbi:MAG: DegV family protein [Anaerolineales bacterium]
MSKVAIVIESTTTLPVGMMDQLNLQSAPARVIWSGEQLRDGIDIQPSDFYTRLASTKEMPTTTQASPEDFRTIYEKLLSDDHDILTIVISSKLSGMYLSAMQARELFPEANIEVIDSLTGAMGVGLTLPKIARVAKQGATLQECKQVAENALKNTGILILVDTLEFLHRGGRIGGAQRYLASALNLKFILEIVDGAFEGVDRVRTHRKALDRITEHLVDRIAGRSPVHVAAMHANDPDTAAKILNMAMDKVEIEESVISEVSPAVGVHLGPGAVGYAFMAGVE